MENNLSQYKFNNDNLSTADIANLILELKKTLTTNACDILEIDDLNALPKAIETYLNNNNYAKNLVLYTNELTKLNWQDANITTSVNWDEDQKVALTSSIGALVDTGQIAIANGTQANLGLLAEIHIVLIDKKTITQSIEDLANYEEFFNVVDITLISGPSRTADIEQKLILGAHGPKKLLVVFI